MIALVNVALYFQRHFFSDLRPGGIRSGLASFDRGWSEIWVREGHNKNAVRYCFRTK